MRSLVIFASLLVLGGCATSDVVFHSPYDLNRDGVLDARCPNVEYDTSRNTLYAWRSKASKECHDQTDA